MKRTWLLLFILIQLLASGCLTNYYSAQLPEPGKYQLGLGASQYTMLLSDSNVNFYGELFVRRGMPLGFDMGLSVHTFWAVVPYSLEFSARKQFRIFSLFNNDIRFNVGAGTVLVFMPGLQVSTDLLFGKTALRFQARRMAIMNNGLDSSNTSNAIAERLMLRAEHDFSLLGFMHITPYIGASWDRSPGYSWETDTWYRQIVPFVNPVNSTQAEFSKPYVIFGISGYFDF